MPDTLPHGRRVLVVDDNADAVESLRLLLELDGHLVATATDGTSALSVAESFRPQLVLLDIELPGLSGYEVAQRLRDRPGGAALTIAALTGWSAQEDRLRCEQAGFDAHLVKPLVIEELQRLLRA